MNEELELRMYCMVLYQLKPIQQGIQSQHAITEYAEQHFNDSNYRKWASKDKTTIILSAGGSNELNDAINSLLLNRVEIAEFKEPDLYDQTTAICFLVDERVWNKLKYPDPNLSYMMNSLITLSSDMNSKFLETIGGQQNLFLRLFLANYKLA